MIALPLLVRWEVSIATITQVLSASEFFRQATLDQSAWDQAGLLPDWPEVPFEVGVLGSRLVSLGGRGQLFIAHCHCDVGASTAARSQAQRSFLLLVLNFFDFFLFLFVVFFDAFFIPVPFQAFIGDVCRSLILLVPTHLAVTCLCRNKSEEGWLD